MKPKFAVVLVLTSLMRHCYGCAGMSNRYYSRHRYQRDPPLIYQEQYPTNAPELSLAASGPPEGKIRRGSSRFTQLLANHNHDIIFKNEEGTMEDRIMSRRCLEKLDTLAVLVMSKWPGIRLRVTEAYDEGGFHAMDSLHYEGRAVDITTSDRDRSKYGMLARLAVHAGFDYVYYESRAHIHASVKVDGAEVDRLRGCFHPSTNIQLRNGQSLPLAEVQVGDEILTLSRDGRLIYSPIILFLDHSIKASAAYLRITTASNRKLYITPNHLIYRVRRKPRRSAGLGGSAPDLATDLERSSLIKLRKIETVYAYQLQMGDHLVTGQEGNLTGDTISEIIHLKDNGYIAPLTGEGTIIANGIAASCYASVGNEGVAHVSFYPYRLLWQLQAFTGRTNVTARTSTVPHGIHWYASLLKWVNSKMELVAMATSYPTP